MESGLECPVVEAAVLGFDLSGRVCQEWAQSRKGIGLRGDRSCQDGGAVASGTEVTGETVVVREGIGSSADAVRDDVSEKCGRLD